MKAAFESIGERNGGTQEKKALTHNFQVEKLVQRLIHFISHDNVVGFASNHCVVLEACGCEDHLTDGFERSIALEELHQFACQMKHEGSKMEEEEENERGII